MANLLELVKELRDRTGAGMMECKKALEASDCDMDKAIDYLRERGIAKSAAKASRIAAEGLACIVEDGNKIAVVEVNSETDFTARTDKFKDMVAVVAKAVCDNEPATVEEALELPTATGKVSEDIAAVSFATGEKMTLRRIEIIKKTDDQIFGKYLHFDGKTAAVAVLNGNKPEVAKAIAMQIASMNPSYVDRDHMPEEIIEHETKIQTELVKADEKNANKPDTIIAKMVEGKVSKALQEMCLYDQAFILDGNQKVSAYLKSEGVSVDSFVRIVVGEGIEKKVDNWVEEVNAALKA